jgi:hypothetical protein
VSSGHSPSNDGYGGVAASWFSEYANARAARRAGPIVQAQRRPQWLQR